MDTKKWLKKEKYNLLFVVYLIIFVVLFIVTMESRETTDEIKLQLEANNKIIEEQDRTNKQLKATVNFLINQNRDLRVDLEYDETLIMENDKDIEDLDKKHKSLAKKQIVWTEASKFTVSFYTPGRGVGTIGASGKKLQPGDVALHKTDLRRIGAKLGDTILLKRGNKKELCYIADICGTKGRVDYVTWRVPRYGLEPGIVYTSEE
jgi:cell division protein FtsB